MKTFITSSVAALVILGSSPSLAQDGVALGMGTITDTATASALDTTGTTSYGTSNHRAQYQLSDLLTAVTEDVRSELSSFLGMALEQEQGSKTYSTTGEATEVASAY